MRAERQKLRTKTCRTSRRRPHSKAYMEGKLKGLGEASTAVPKFLKGRRTRTGRRDAP